MGKNKETLTEIELALTKEKDSLNKQSVLFQNLIKQRKNLKNKAKIVSLLEYKKIVIEILEIEKNINDTNKKIDELLIKYEKNKKNQKP